jgi:hypothetical protein
MGVSRENEDLLYPSEDFPLIHYRFLSLHSGLFARYRVRLPNLITSLLLHSLSELVKLPYFYQNRHSRRTLSTAMRQAR